MHVHPGTVILCSSAWTTCGPLMSCSQVAYCTAAVAFEDGRRPQFEVPYDVAVVAVGERPATFGVPGRKGYNEAI